MGPKSKSEDLAARAKLLQAPDVVRLSTEEVALATGLAPATLWRWACVRPQGALLPCIKRGGRNLYRPADVRRWLGIDEEGAAQAA